MEIHYTITLTYVHMAIERDLKCQTNLNNTCLNSHNNAHVKYAYIIADLK